MKHDVTVWEAVEKDLDGATPPPGIYQGVPFEEYLRWECKNNSSLDAAMRSPLHYKVQAPIERTDPMRIGSLIHMGKFEPFHLLDNYAIFPKEDLLEEAILETECTRQGAVNTTYFKNKKKEWFEKNKGKDHVTDAELKSLKGMVRQLTAHKRTSEYFSDGYSEVCIVWVDPTSGLLCKARIDFWQPSKARFTDLKSTDDISNFGRKIDGWNYHRQLAMYGDGLLHLGHPVVERCIVAAERDEPWGVKAAPVAARDICEGRTQYKWALLDLAEAESTGIYPSYEDPDVFERPRWKQDREHELVVQGEVIKL